MSETTSQFAGDFEFLVHGQVREAVIVPSLPHQAMELWIQPTDAIEAFSQLVGRQSGATIRGNRVWFFRPMDIPVQQDGQTIVMKKMLALDGGQFTDAELASIRHYGIKLRTAPVAGEQRGLLVVTPGDIMEFTGKLTFSAVTFTSVKEAAPATDGGTPVSDVDPVDAPVEPGTTKGNVNLVEQQPQASIVDAVLTDVPPPAPTPEASTPKVQAADAQDTPIADTSISGAQTSQSQTSQSQASKSNVPETKTSEAPADPSKPASPFRRQV